MREASSLEAEPSGLRPQRQKLSWEVCAASCAARAMAARRRARAARPPPLRPPASRSALSERFDGWNSVITGAEGELSSLTSSDGPLALSGCCRWRTTRAAAAGWISRSAIPTSRARRTCATRLASSTSRRRPQRVLAREGIFLAMTALLEPGDHVVATSPCYQSLTEVARSVGARITPWTPGMEKRFAPEQLRELVEPGRAARGDQLPAQPDGRAAVGRRVGRRRRDLRRHRRRLFHDEMYRGLEHGNAPSLLPACDLTKRGITLGGLSKTYGLPGLRIGWLASRDAALMARVTGLKDYTSITPPAPAEALAFVALRAREKIIAAAQTPRHRAGGDESLLRRSRGLAPPRVVGAVGGHLLPPRLKGGARPPRTAMRC